MPSIKEAEGDEYLLHFHYSESKVLNDFLISMHEIRSPVNLKFTIFSLSEQRRLLHNFL